MSQSERTVDLIVAKIIERLLLYLILLLLL